MSKIIDTIKSTNYIFSLATDDDGSCPCADFSFKDDRGTVKAHSRCWRVSDNSQDLYVWGEHPNIKEIAQALKEALDKTEWYNPYTIIMEEWS